MKVVTLTAEMNDIKKKLSCSQEQFVDLLQKYYTQQLVLLDDPDAVPDWVMQSFRDDLRDIFKELRGHPRITQGQWITILKTALQDAQDGWPSQCIPLPQPAQPAQPAKPDTFDDTHSKFQEMGRKLKEESEAEVIEVAKDSQDDSESDEGIEASQLTDDPQVWDTQERSSDDEAASDPPSDSSSDAEPKSKKAKTEEP